MSWVGEVVGPPTEFPGGGTCETIGTHLPGGHCPRRATVRVKCIDGNDRNVCDEHHEWMRRD